MMSTKVASLMIPMMLMTAAMAEAAPKAKSPIVMRDLARGDKRAQLAHKVKRDRDRARLMHQAGIEYNRALRRAEKAARKASGPEAAILGRLIDEAKDKMVGSLNYQTKYHFERKAISKAKKLNRASLKLRPKNSDALTYQWLLANATKASDNPDVDGSSNSIASARWAARRSTTNPQARSNARRAVRR